MLIDIIAGARPNFIKIAPIIAELETRRKNGDSRLSYRLVHTGQHYDDKMSGDFFQQLSIPQPHVNLGAGSGSQAEQTAKIMVGYEGVLMKDMCDLTLVVGDVTSTMACGITAKKLNVRLAHVEAGIRSHDLTMPEEINRMVTDSISDYFYTTTRLANQNLLKTGVAEEKIVFVGNTMIDTLYGNLEKLRQPEAWERFNLEERGYIVMTLHRPSNVDERNSLKSIIDEIILFSRGIPVIFPVHPRTLKVFQEMNLTYDNLLTIDPLGYLEFNFLVKNAKAVITDSGGITEETTVMGIPCMTLRPNTERPETCEIGTNELLGSDPKRIGPAFDKLFSGTWKKGTIPELWDGRTAPRIVDHLLSLTN